MALSQRLRVFVHAWRTGQRRSSSRTSLTKPATDGLPARLLRMVVVLTEIDSTEFKAKAPAVFLLLFQANLGGACLARAPSVDTANARVAGWGSLVDAIEKVLALKARLFLSLEV
jgi:hypothetical protein